MRSEGIHDNSLSSQQLFYIPSLCIPPLPYRPAKKPFTPKILAILFFSICHPMSKCPSALSVLFEGMSKHVSSYSHHSTLYTQSRPHPRPARQKSQSPVHNDPGPGRGRVDLTPPGDHSSKSQASYLCLGRSLHLKSISCSCLLLIFNSFLSRVFILVLPFFTVLYFFSSSTYTT